MSSPDIDFERLRDQLQPDGSLRDIYVQHADEQLWRRFLVALIEAPYRCVFRHGERLIQEPPSQFKDAAKLSETDPVLLRIELSPILALNCHFFTDEEIELDVAPRDLQRDDAVTVLVDFLKWLARIVERPVLLTHENSPEHVILRIEVAGTNRRTAQANCWLAADGVDTIERDEPDQD